MAILPGDLKKKQLIEQMIRVDHAGEYGAKQIYLGQLSVLKNSQDQQLLKHMAAQEEVHLDYFTKSI
jgi:ubiquinone biosynthesis monooxygenase Coq7